MKTTINIQTLEDTPAGGIIARGEAKGLNPLNEHRLDTWIAFKDYEGKWVVKYGIKGTPDPVIMTIGLPVVCLRKIAELVDCDSESMWYYAENPYHLENRGGIIQEIYDALVSLEGEDEAENIYRSCVLESYQDGHPLPEILKGEYNRVRAAVHA